MMTHAREFAGLLAVSLGCLVLWDVDRTVNNVNDSIPMMVQGYSVTPVDIHGLTVELTKDSKEIAHDIHQDMLVAGGAEGETEKTMRLIRSEAPSFIAQGHQELSATHDLLVSAKLTTGEAQKAIAEISTIPDHANPLLESLAKASDSVSPAMNGLTNYVNGPLTFATSNAGELEDTTNTAVGHVDAHWLKPWDGTHPYRHYAGVGLGYIGIGATIVRDTK